MDNTSAPSTENEETALVRAAREDRAAFGEVYRRYVTQVYRYLRMRTATDEDAADLTQQVFLPALDALPRYEDRGLPFGAWLLRIARNVAADVGRRERVTVSWEQVPEACHPPDGEDVEAAVTERERLARLRRVLDELDPDERDLITLHFVGGLTQREIALILGKSQSGVHRLLARALQTLRERYDEE